jgi:hypothetical protein
LLGGAFIALSYAIPRPASADPAADQYQVTVIGNSVEVCLGYRDTCRSSMLRQDVDGGAVVALAGFLNDGGCYIDECVLPGTYRYGCEMPLPCACNVTHRRATSGERVDADPST